jgi:hypothetical protein
MHLPRVLRLQADVIVHGTSEPLLASEVAFGSLHRNVPGNAPAGALGAGAFLGRGCPLRRESERVNARNLALGALRTKSACAAWYAITSTLRVWGQLP